MIKSKNIFERKMKLMVVIGVELIYKFSENIPILLRRVK